MEIEPQNIRHSDEMQDIITTVPARLIRWGMTLFLCVLVMIIGLSAFIHYPDIIRTTLTISDDGQGKESFFGKIILPASEIGKVHSGQTVLIKFKRYPFEQYGIIKGAIKSISKTADNTGSYIALVTILSNTTKINNAIRLETGILADAGIVTQDATILQRISQSVFKAIKNK